MKFPSERILIVRPCLKAICLGVRSASKLLSVLLYRSRNCAEDETKFTFTCTQAELVDDLCEELTAKQLHDMAIPALQLFGYLSVNGSGFRHIYTVHLDRVQAALSCYENRRDLELLLISFIREQLELVPMELELVPMELEEVLNQLELLLKTIGKTSNSRRGRKPRPQAASSTENDFPKNNIDSLKETITDREREEAAYAATPTQDTPVNVTVDSDSREGLQENEDVEATVKMPAIRVTKGASNASDHVDRHGTGNPDRRDSGAPGGEHLSSPPRGRVAPSEQAPSSEVGANVNKLFTPDHGAGASTMIGQHPSQAGKKPRKHGKVEALPALSQDELTLWDEWCGQFKTSPPLGEKTIRDVKLMLLPVTTWAGILNMTRAALMRDIRLWIHERDKTGYYRRGVTFCDFTREFWGWQEAKQHEMDGKCQQHESRSWYADDDYSIPAQMWRESQRATQGVLR